MSLFVVNPTPTPRRRKRAAVKPRPQKAISKGATMARRRSAAQKAATRKMLAANRRHRNPSSRKATSRRRIRRNPTTSRVSYHRRRHRNPASSGVHGLLDEIMSKDGLMMIGSVVAAPFAIKYVVGMLMPTASGNTKLAVNAGVGLGLGWAVHKYINKKAGLMIGLVSLGSAAAELLNTYISPSSANPNSPAFIGPPAPAGTPTAGGYSRRSTLGGYTQTHEPGLTRF